MAKLTIDQLLAKKLENKKKTVMFASKVLGGDIEVVKVPLCKILNLLDDNEGLSSSESMAKNYELIYECCPVMHSKELQSGYEPSVPYEIVPLLLDDNVGEINELAGAILNLYGIDIEGLKDTAKKQ